MSAAQRMCFINSAGLDRVAVADGSFSSRDCSAGMGFSIDYGFGFIGAVVITFMITAAIIVFVFFGSAAKQAHDSVVEDEGDDKALIA